MSVPRFQSCFNLRLQLCFKLVRNIAKWMAVKKTNSRREFINLYLLLNNRLFHRVLAKLLGKMGVIQLLEPNRQFLSPAG